MVEIGFDQSGLWTLKLTVSQEWTDGINWFFACSDIFTKIKSWSKICWVGIVKNGCGQSGHKTQKRSKKDSSLLIYDTLKSAVC